MAVRIGLLWAALITTFGPWAQASLPPSPTEEVAPTDEARKQFSLGVALLKDPDGARYEDAYKAFLRAYTISPSWKILSNLGLCAFKLERFTDAIEAYERYLTQGKSEIDPVEKQQIERDIEVMRGSSGIVTLSIAGRSSGVLTDTRQRTVGGPVVNEYVLPPDTELTLHLMAGRHRLVVTSEGRKAEMDLDVVAGRTETHAFSLPEPQTASPSSETKSPSPFVAPVEPAAEGSGVRTAAFITGGVGLALAAGGAVTGLIGRNKRLALQADCPAMECAPATEAERRDFESRRDALRTYQTATNILLVSGGLLATTGVTLFVLGGNSEPEQEARRVRIAPHAAADGWGFSAWGAF